MKHVIGRVKEQKAVLCNYSLTLPVLREEAVHARAAVLLDRGEGGHDGRLGFPRPRVHRLRERSPRFAARNCKGQFASHLMIVQDR